MRRFLAAVQFLTIVPAPGDLAPARGVAFFPIVGALVGAIAGGIARIPASVFPPPIAALLALIFLVAITGALHEDGLADVFDAFRAGRPPERIHAILKDSRIGSYGGAALVLSLLLRWQCIALAGGRSVPALAAAVGASRGRWAREGVLPGAEPLRGGGRLAGNGLASLSLRTPGRRRRAGFERGCSGRGTLLFSPPHRRSDRRLSGRGRPDFRSRNAARFHMSSLYLIRHEEPEMRGRFIGRTDPPLTPEGRAAAAAKLGRLDVRIIYSSPMQRARETAGAIGCAETIVLPELAEIDFGEWEGLSWDEIERRWPGTAARKVEDWLGVTTPGGEAWRDFCARVDRALERILAGPRPAAIVAHMVVNAALAERLLGSNPKQFHQHYGEIIACDCAAGNSFDGKPGSLGGDRRTLG